MKRDVYTEQGGIGVYRVRHSRSVGRVERGHEEGLHEAKVEESGG